MARDEHDLIANERKLMKGPVILVAILALLILGHFAGRALYHRMH